MDLAEGVPLKVQSFVRIPSKQNLNVLCVEMEWNLRITFLYVAFLVEVMGVHALLQGLTFYNILVLDGMQSEKYKCLGCSVWYAVIWVLWENRNQIIFSNKKQDAAEMFQPIQLFSWKWASDKLQFLYPFSCWCGDTSSCWNTHCSSLNCKRCNLLPLTFTRVSLTVFKQRITHLHTRNSIRD